ncbi:MAG: sortase [Candidatus Moranbacteria bacterium]|nr:sortase [Candidatus Moranbacteria bacterium]
MHEQIIFFERKPGLLRRAKADVLSAFHDMRDRYRAESAARSFERAKAASVSSFHGTWLKPTVVFVIAFAVLFSLANVDFRVVFDTLARLRGEMVIRESLSSEWLAKYSIVVNGRVHPNDDADHDGLGFLYEQEVGTNPYGADTDHDGVSDHDELERGTDPLGTGDLDSDSDDMPDPWEMANGLDPKKNDAMDDPDADGLPNIGEYAYGTDPRKSDTDGDGFDDAREIGSGYDPDAPGDTKPDVTVLVERIGIAAPMIWSGSENDRAMLKDLENGVIRYPDSGVPGQSGNVIIAGHSSNYAWARGDYNSVFSRLGELAPGDRIVLRMRQANGKTFDYSYLMTEKRVTSPDDPWIFTDDGKDEVTLSTCWPLGTAFKRLVIRGRLEEDRNSV